MARKSVDDQLRIYTQQMGLVPDQEIARMAGVSRAVVVNFRQKNNIPAYEGHRHRGEAGEEAATVEADPAGAFPVSTNEEDPAAFRGRRSALDSYRHLLGRVPDARVAAKAGVTAENVRSYRTRRNIPPAWNREDAGDAEGAADPGAVDPGAVDPGVDPEVVVPGAGDAEVADPAADPGAADPLAAGDGEADPALEPAEIEGDPGEDAEGAPAPLWSPGAISFVAVVGLPSGLSHRYVVLAADIVQAAQIAVAGVAARHPGAEVRSVEKVAPMFDAELA